AGDFHLVAASDAPHHAAEVAEPVDRDHGSFFEWRCEKRTRHMSAVMLDEMKLSIVRAGHAAMFELLFDLRNAHAVRRPARRLAPRRRPCSDAPQFLQEMRFRIARNRDVGEFRIRTPRDTSLGGRDWQSGPMLEAIKTLLFDGHF